MVICPVYIQTYFDAVVEEAQELFPELSITPKLQIRLHSESGYVIGNLVSISKAFIGTKDFGELHETIRHEIAHVVTPSQGHNKHWKRAAKLLGCSGNIYANYNNFSDDYKKNYPVVVYLDQKIIYFGMRKPKNLLLYYPKESIIDFIKS